MIVSKGHYGASLNLPFDPQNVSFAGTMIGKHSELRGKAGKPHGRVRPAILKGLMVTCKSISITDLFSHCLPSFPELLPHTHPLTHLLKPHRLKVTQSDKLHEYGQRSTLMFKICRRTTHTVCNRKPGNRGAHPPTGEILVQISLNDNQGITK